MKTLGIVNPSTSENLQTHFKIQQIDEYFKKTKPITFAQLLETTQTNAKDITASTIPPIAEQINAQPAEQSTPTNSTGNDFIKTIWPLAKKAASVLGLDPKILVAQVVLETGWGKFIAKATDGTSSNNIFNIKDNAENSVRVPTTEYIAGKPVAQVDSFKKYSSLEESFNDYIVFIKENKRYQTALTKTANPHSYMRELHKAGYASDPNYVDKIMSIFHSEKLNQTISHYT